MTKKQLRVLTIMLFFLPILLLSGFFLHDKIKDYNPRVKPVESAYFEGTVHAVSHQNETEIELSYAVEFHHYRSYPTRMTGTFTLNGETYCNEWEEPSIYRSTLRSRPRSERMAQKRAGVTESFLYHYFEEGEPFVYGEFTVAVRVILENKQPRYWHIFLRDTEGILQRFCGPAASPEEARRIFWKFFDTGYSG